jgi:hypothetical protein
MGGLDTGTVGPGEREGEMNDQRENDRWAAEAARLYDQACRSRWRSLLLLIKATLESIEIGIISEDEAFIAQTVGQDGRTVAEIFV